MKHIRFLKMTTLILLLGIAASCAKSKDGEESQLIEELRQARGPDTRDVQMRILARGDSMLPYLESVWIKDGDPRMRALSFVTVAGISPKAYVANLSRIKGEQVEILLSMLSEEALRKVTAAERRQVRVHLEQIEKEPLSPAARANVKRLQQLLEGHEGEDTSSQQLHPAPNP